ncbi:GMC family oxidoreductase [Halorubrum sp. DTA46]|uniref:GMC family oxidoreductase n=1 Tax=Halorubrum sp. DTA46 TaxID=3402162 RepID=UPI003AAB0C02
MTGTIDRTPTDADVCVVGAGPAGAMVAYSLAKRGHDVVVLEAGERLTPEDHRRRMELWLRPEFWRGEFWVDEERDDFSSTGEIPARLNHTRVKAVGGTSLHWDANTPRLHEKDFEMNTRYGVARDWPIEYADLRPYYALAEREMGVSGADDNPFGPPREEPFPLEAFPPSYSDSLFAEACEELGIEMHSQPKAINSEPYDDRAECVGYGVCNACPVNARYTAEVHVQKAEAEGARVVDQAQVLRVQHDREGTHVDGVEYATPAGSRHRQTADHYVLACGGIETPRLLLLSASTEHPDGLANGSGAVGRYLMDHPNVQTWAELDDSTRQNNIGWISSRTDQFYDHEAPPPGSFYLTFDNNAESSRGGIERKDPTVTRLLATAGNPSPARVGETVRDPFDEAQFGEQLAMPTTADPPHSVSIRGVCEMLPRPENRVTLDRSKTDNHGRPVPSIELADGPHEKRTMERCLAVQEDIMDELGAEISRTSTLADRSMSTHHMGTTRMGTDPDESVVDSQGRTHELENLWIASSSVFPTGGAVNPTLTIAALALKTADHIDAQL